MLHLSVLCALLVCIIPLLSGVPIPDDEDRIRKADRTLRKAHISIFKASLTSKSERDLWNIIEGHTHLAGFTTADFLRILSKRQELTQLAAQLYQIPILNQIFEKAGEVNDLVRMTTALVKGTTPQFGEVLNLLNGQSKHVDHDIGHAVTIVLREQYIHHGLSHQERWSKAVGKPIEVTHTEMSNNKYLVTSSKGKEEENVNVAQLMEFILGNMKPLMSTAKEFTELFHSLPVNILLYNLMQLNFDVVKSKTSLAQSYHNKDQGAAKTELITLITDTQTNYNDQRNFTYKDILMAAQAGVLPIVKTLYDMGKIIFGL